MSALKFKVGDKVRVRADLVVGKKYGAETFTSEMVKFKGESYKIKSNSSFYLLEGINEWVFTDEMLAKVEEKFEEKVEEKVEEKTEVKIVKCLHVNYQLKTTKSVCYFKTYDNVKEGDYVYGDTCNGLMICVVDAIYTKIEEVINLKDIPFFSFLKECRLTLNNKEVI